MNKLSLQEIEQLLSVFSSTGIEHGVLYQLRNTIKENDKLRLALEKIDWYFTLSDNHPMIQKNVQKCRQIITEVFKEEPENG